MEAARHHRLHVAIAFASQRGEDALAGDNADQAVATHYGKIILQAVNRLLQRIFQRVRGSQHGELGQHNVLHVDGIHDTLEKHALVFQLSADQDKKSR